MLVNKKVGPTIKLLIYKCTQKYNLYIVAPNTGQK